MQAVTEEMLDSTEFTTTPGELVDLMGRMMNAYDAGGDVAASRVLAVWLMSRDLTPLHLQT